MRNTVLATLSLTLSFFINAQSTGLKLTPPEQLRGIPLASTPFAGSELPSIVDLSDRMPPAGDQGNQNSCVAWAIGYACKSYQEKHEEGNSYWTGGSINSNAIFSPAFIYNQINNGVDGGSFFTDALNIVSQQGAVKWSEMPYREVDYLSVPSQTVKQKAKKYRIDFWRRVNFYDEKEVKAQLNAGFPVIIGAIIDRGFINNGWNVGAQDYIWNSASGSQGGGHAMLVVGYDDSRSAFKVLNSWGLNWGNSGYCWISYSYFTTVVREAYVMKDAVNGPDNSPSPSPLPIVNPTSDLTVNFTLTNVAHNLSDYQLGTVMRLYGFADIPQGMGNQVQIVVRFYFNNGSNGKGLPVQGLSPYFRMPDGSAACGTQRSSIIPGNQQWYAVMPYQSLNVPRGGYNNFGQYVPRTSHLIAEPTLYIDDFAVAKGQLIPFYVNL